MPREFFRRLPSEHVGHGIGFGFGDVLLRLKGLLEILSRREGEEGPVSALDGWIVVGFGCDVDFSRGPSVHVVEENVVWQLRGEPVGEDLLFGRFYTVGATVRLPPPARYRFGRESWFLRD